MKLNKYKPLLLIILFTVSALSFGQIGNHLLSIHINGFSKCNLISIPAGINDQVEPISSSDYQQPNPANNLEEWVETPQRLSYVDTKVSYDASDTIRPSIQVTNYTAHDPIVITNNDDFSALGFPGRGDAVSPYLIEHYNIRNSTTHLISISDTNVHFKIDDNILDGITGTYNGIYLVNVTNGEIHNNTVKFTNHGVYLDASYSNELIINDVFSNSFNGIWLRDSFSNFLSNNTVFYNGHGISLSSSTNNIICYNEVFNNSQQGIALWDSSSNQIYHNIIEYNTWKGIIVTHSVWNQISANTIYGNLNEGIYLFNENNTIVEDNFISNSASDGIFVNGSSNNVNITANTIQYNTKRGILAHTVFDILISANTIRWNDAQGISIWNSVNVNVEFNVVEDSSGSGMFVVGSSIINIFHNDVFRNLRLYLMNQTISGAGITTINSDCTVSENIISDNYVHGMVVIYVTGIDIFNNTIEMNGQSGIYSEGFNDSYIYENRIGANYANGIVLNASHFNYVGYNVIGQNGANGIFLVDSHDNYFEHNEIYGNNGTTLIPLTHLAHLAIQGSTTGHGIFLDPSFRNVITENTIHSNTGTGIYLLGSENTSINHNEVFENFENGLFLENSHNNEIARNIVFLNGDFSFIQAPTDEGILFSIHGSTTGHGIFLDPSDGNTIVENTISDNRGNGISLQESDDTVIFGNSIAGNSNGVYLENSSHNNISMNTICRSGLIIDTAFNLKIDFSILGSTTGHGIFLDPSDFNHLEGNNVYDNVQSGIYILDSDNTDVSNNILSVNGLYGLQIDSTSSGTTINGNDFFENNRGDGSQAYDDGLDNFFDGNYWSDLPPGADGYYIDGSANNVDYNPSKQPINLPEYNIGGLNVVYPNGGEELSGEVKVIWTRMYSDSSLPEEIQYWLFHSDNNGESWNLIPLHEYWTETLPDGTIAIATMWDTKKVNNGENNLIRVIGIDTMGYTLGDTSDGTFTIENIPITTEPSTTTTTTTTAAITSGWTLFLSLAGFILYLGFKRRKHKYK